jgi:hypothetical protein
LKAPASPPGPSFISCVSAGTEPGGKCDVGQLATVPSAAAVLWQVSTRPRESRGGSGRSLNHNNRASNGIQVDKGVAPFPLFLFSAGSRGCHIKCEMKAPRIDPAVPELAALSALAAVGCGLAAAQGDLWFVTVFGAASVVTMIEVVRRLL